MSDSKDTVMSPRDILLIKRESRQGQTVDTPEQMLLRKQAEISFAAGKQAGREEVAEWLKQRGVWGK
jgi:hypothetical protein